MKLLPLQGALLIAIIPRAVTCHPVRAKALKLLAIYKAVALTGRIAHCLYTQGDALG